MLQPVPFKREGKFFCATYLETLPKTAVVNSLVALY